MSVISSVINFEENLSKNLPYCNLLLEKMTGNSRSVKVCEHAAMASLNENMVISRICEGYQFVIAFSGELFNTSPLFEKLSSFGYRFCDQSDAELALFCYIHFGEESPGLLSGNFSYIIYDSMRRQSFAAVDNMASMPLFYTENSAGAVTSSKISSLLSYPGFSAKTTTCGISELLCASGNTTGNVFDKIYAIPPAHSLKITAGGITKKKYSPVSNSLSPEEIVEQALLKCPSKVSVIYTGTEQDRQLLRLLAKRCSTRITVYSRDFYDIFKEFSVKWQRVPLCEESIFSSLEHIVEMCGIPPLSCDDFVLLNALRRLCDKNELIFTSFSANCENRSYLKILLENDVLHPALKETLAPENSAPGFALNTPQILADGYGIRLSSPFLRQGGALAATDLAKTQLRHILLSIISRDTSPILAFFKSGALLRLCEGGFDFPDADLSEAELISYIIKLNIWFEKFRPIIL